MSRFEADGRREPLDEGFSLVEVIVAMVIFLVVVISTTPLLIGGLTAGRASQLNLQGKALGQERLERMRNLPYHVARQNGQYLDVLDIYFRDTVPVGALAVLPAVDVCSARSYAATTATYSCEVDNLGSEYPGFRQVITTQFLRADRSVVTPIAAYTSQTAGVDSAPSNLLSVTVRTQWTQSSKNRSFTVRSLIANAQSDPSIISAALRASALDLTSNLATGDVLQLEGGLLSSEGSLSTGSTASLSAVPARAGLASGSSAVGATLTLSAPPAANGLSPSVEMTRYLDGATCTFACFGRTFVLGDQNVTVTSGEPKVSTAGSPLEVRLRRTAINLERGFSYSNATPAETKPALGVVGPMVSGGALGGPYGPSGPDVLRGSGYLDATGAGPTSVRVSSSVRLDHLELFPTIFAPAGVVQVVLDDATLTCQSGAGSSVASASWSGRVRYWSGTGYVPLTLAPGAPALPPPSTLSVLPGQPLSTWVQSWSALTSAGSVNESAGRRGKGTLSAVLTVLTAETRSGDATSPINIAVGTASCLTEDLR